MAVLAAGPRDSFAFTSMRAPYSSGRVAHHPHSLCEPTRPAAASPGTKTVWLGTSIVCMQACMHAHMQPCRPWLHPLQAPPMRVLTPGEVVAHLWTGERSIMRRAVRVRGVWGPLPSLLIGCYGGKQSSANAG